MISIIKAFIVSIKYRLFIRKSRKAVLKAAMRRVKSDFRSLPLHAFKIKYEEL